MKKHIENFYKHIQDSCRDFDKKNFDLEEINKIVIVRYYYIFVTT